MRARDVRKVLDNLRECTARQIQHECTRDCQKCNLLMPCNEVLEGLETAIKSIDFIEANRDKLRR